MADYRITADVDINASELDAVEKRINSLNNKDINLKANIDFDASKLESKMQAATSKLRLSANLEYNEKDLVKYANRVQRQITAIQNKMNSKGTNSNELKAMETELNRLVGRYQTVLGKLAGNYSDETAKTVNEIGASLDNLYQRFKGRQLDLGVDKQFDRLRSTLKEISNLEIGRLNLDSSSNEYADMTKRIKQLKDEARDLTNVLSPHMTNSMFSTLSDDIDTYDAKFSRAKSKSDDLGFAEAAKKEEAEAKAVFQRIEKLNNEMYSRKKKLVGMDESSLSYEQETKSIRELETEIDGLTTKLRGFDSSVTGGMFDKLSESAQKFKRDIDGLEAQKIQLAIDEEIKQENARVEVEFQKLRSLYNDINKLELQKTKGNLGANELAVVEQRIDSLKASANELQASLAPNMTSTMFDTLADDAQRAGVSAERAKAQIQDLKNASISSLNNQLGSKGFMASFETLNTQINKMKSVPPTLQRSLSELQESYNEIWELSNKGVDADNFDEANRAIEKFNRKLKETQNLYRAINANRSMSDFTERQERATQALQNQKAVLDKQIVAWLNNNSRAADDFGDRLDDIRLRLSQLNGNDVQGLKNLKAEFQSVKLEADALDKTGLKFGDRLKKQFNEYISYIGVAGALAAVVEGFRYMAQNVLEVDTAMTGLYRVTDLTSKQYDTMFDRMISSAQQYGNTLTDTINATSDWVRAGFDENTSLDLAEITSMYQHVSDLDYSEAAENLLTAYKGFQSSFNQEFGNDAAASVEHIADVYNELDNQFAVTSTGLGEGIARSASALELAGNTFEEAAA